MAAHRGGWETALAAHPDVAISDTQGCKIRHAPDSVMVIDLMSEQPTNRAADQAAGWQQ